MTIEPIYGSPFTYRVSSDSRPGESYITDLLQGVCSCPNWVCRQHHYKATTGKQLVCKHQRAAKEYAMEEILEHARETLLSK